MTVADRAGDEHLADPKRKIEIEESGDDVVSSSRHTPLSYSPHRHRIVSISIFVSAREDPRPPETAAAYGRRKIKERERGPQRRARRPAGQSP